MSISKTPSVTPSISPSSGGLVEIQVTNNSGVAGITNMKVNNMVVIDFQTVYPSDSYSFYTTYIGNYNIELTIGSNNSNTVAANCVGSNNVPDCNDLLGNGTLTVYALNFGLSQPVTVDLTDSSCP